MRYIYTPLINFVCLLEEVCFYIYIYLRQESELCEINFLVAFVTPISTKIFFFHPSQGIFYIFFFHIFLFYFSMLDTVTPCTVNMSLNIYSFFFHGLVFFISQTVRKKKNDDNNF